MGGVKLSTILHICIVFTVRCDSTLIDKKPLLCLLTVKPSDDTKLT